MCATNLISCTTIPRFSQAWKIWPIWYVNSPFIVPAPAQNDNLPNWSVDSPNADPSQKKQLLEHAYYCKKCLTSSVFLLCLYFGICVFPWIFYQADNQDDGNLAWPPVVVFQFPMQISHLQVFEMFGKNMFKSSVLIVVLVSTAIFSISDANIAFASLPATRAGSLQDIQFKTSHLRTVFR